MVICAAEVAEMDFTRFRDGDYSLIHNALHLALQNLCIPEDFPHSAAIMHPHLHTKDNQDG